MRVVTLEEHFIIPALLERVPRSAIEASGWPSGFSEQMMEQTLIADFAERRISEMDAAGIAMQVLSWVGPGADLLDGFDAVALARRANDQLAKAIRRHPDRYAGFALLPMGDPACAAAELERATRELGLCGAMIHGQARGRFLDDVRFQPLLERAEALDVPLYLHPGLPPRSVYNAYFNGLGDDLSFILSTGGWGWHAETALHILRLVLSGTLDRFRGLRLIVGHMGEGLPAMLARCDHLFASATDGRLARAVSQTILDQLWITTSGFFDLPSFTAALMSFGTERMLFSVDYPFASMQEGRAFLDMVPLSPSDRAKLAHGNADRLLGLTP